MARCSPGKEPSAKCVMEKLDLIKEVEWAGASPLESVVGGRMWNVVQGEVFRIPETLEPEQMAPLLCMHSTKQLLSWNLRMSGSSPCHVDMWKPGGVHSWDKTPCSHSRVRNGYSKRVMGEVN